MVKNRGIEKSLAKLASSNQGFRIKLRAKPTKRQGYSVYLDHFINRKRDYEFLGLYLIGDKDQDSITVAKALEIRNLRESELVYTQAGMQRNSWKRKSDFKEYYQARAKKKGHPWSSAYKALDSFHPGALMFIDVDQKLAEEFKKYLMEKYKQATVSLYYTLFKSALNTAVKEQIIFTNPAAAVTVKRAESKREFLTIDEVKTLEKTDCQFPEVKRAFLFACYTGLRISDIVRLDWEAIDYQGNQISLRMKKTDTMLYIPLIPEAKKLLDAPTTGKVFDLVSHAYINRILKDWVKDAGITKNISFHTARHTFAIMGIDAGLGMHIIQKLLGHSALEITMIYAKVRDKNLQDAAEKIQNLYDGGK